MPADVEIQDLVLRIPGIDRDTARCVAHDVARRLADELPGWASRPRSALDVRVTVPAGLPPAELARRIAAALARSLR